MKSGYGYTDGYDGQRLVSIYDLDAFGTWKGVLAPDFVAKCELTSINRDFIPTPILLTNPTPAEYRDIFEPDPMP